MEKKYSVVANRKELMLLVIILCVCGCIYKRQIAEKKSQHSH